MTGLRRRELLAAGAALGAAPGWATRRDGGAKTLRIAFPAPESSFDPAQTNSDLYSTTVISHILEAPLAYDYLARPVRLQPLTAAALPEMSADARTFTLRIRPGILFADDPAFGGRPRELTAHDYVYSLKRFYDPRWKSSDLYLFENAKVLGLSELRRRALQSRRPFDYDTEAEGCRALDRYTWQVRLAEPNPRFVYRFAEPGVLGALAREVVEHYGDEIGAHPVGTGAFRLAGWRRGSRIELERSPTYRGTRYDGTPADDPLAQAIAARLAGRTLPLVDRVQIDIVEEAQPRWLTFLRGEYDYLVVPGPFAPLAVPNGKLAPFLEKKGVRLQSALQPDMSMHYFNMDDPLVGGYAAHNVALRRAIALSFDGDAYVRLVLGGLGVRAQSTIAPFTSGYDATYRSEMSEHDPAKAKALLDLYGYVDRDADGWRETPDGRPLVLRIASMSSQLDRTTNEIWKRSLDAVGLRVVFEISTWPDLLKRTRTGSLMIWGFSWGATTPDGAFFLSIAYGPNASESNDARFAMPAFDRLFERQSALPDGPERDALLTEGKNLLVAYMPYKAHVHRVAADLVQPWTHGYWRHPFRRDLWHFVDVDRSGAQA